MNKKPTISFDLPDLPVEVDYLQLVEHITQANTALARLDEMLKQIGGERNLERMYFTREAVLSSKIEGTQVTLEDVLKDDADGEEKKEEKTEKQRDLREVINYRKAMREGVSIIDNDMPLTENNIKKLHKILLTSVRGKNRAPGEYRKEQVYIAPEGTPIDEARYIPPDPRDIGRLYGNFDRYFNDHNIERDPLVQIAVAHYQFEAMHPF